MRNHVCASKVKFVKLFANLTRQIVIEHNLKKQ